jgi:hypothetical protein
MRELHVKKGNVTGVSQAYVKNPAGSGRFGAATAL